MLHNAFPDDLHLHFTAVYCYATRKTENWITIFLKKLQQNELTLMS